MGKSSPPSAPDPSATAAAQGTANVDTAAAQAALNDVNTNTPYGSTNYQQTGSYTTPGGETVPTYTQNTSLTPLAQQLLTGEQQTGASLVPGAEQLAGTVGSAINTPLNFNTADSGTLSSTPQVLDSNAANAEFNQENSFLQPQFQQNQSNLQDQLSRQGIGVGSDAYSNAETQLQNSQNQQTQSAEDQALATGSGAAANMFNMALSGQQQNIAQQQLAQSQPLSLLSQLFGATPTTPTQPITSAPQVGVSPTDVIGATGLSQNAAEANYQASLQQQNSLFGGLAGLGGAALLAL